MKPKLLANKQLVQLENNKNLTALDSKEYLNGAHPITKIPPDFIRVSDQTYQNGEEMLSIPNSIWANLQLLSERAGTTQHIVLLTVFKLLLSRLTPQEDIVVGVSTPSQNKMQSTDHLITKSVLYANLSGATQFINLLKQVAQTTHVGKSKIALPSEEAYQETDNVTIIFYLSPNEITSLTGKAKEALPYSQNTSYDIKFRIEKQSANTLLSLTYNANLYLSARMEELLAQYDCLLKQIINNPSQSILEYSLITEKAATILPNPTEPIESEWKKSVPEMVAERAQHTPQATALIDNQGHWTYAELDVQSNQISHYLIESDIKAQDIVVILAHRDASLALAILGSLKAGAAFLILDPAYPPNRLLNQLNQSPPQAFLHLDGAGKLPAELDSFLNKNKKIHYLKISNTPILSSNNPLRTYPTTSPNIQISPDALAYIAFTSGSTGKPKGIIGTHRPLAHFFPWHIKTFGFKPSDRFSMLSGLAHDPILRDIFTPLCLGSTLYIPSQDELLNPNKLFAWLKDHAVSVMHLTPSLSQIITAKSASENHSLPSLKYAFFGGEPLTYPVIESLSALAPNISCVNFYGATETPQAMAYYPLKKTASEQPQEKIPLGQGISDVQLLILNKNNDLAGIGELGEIFIRTPYLSKGYLGDSSLTSERYLINPFTKTISDRLYKTGDLGRYRPDGLINFFERADQQVKIRGFRIELAEIEYVLAQFPDIKDCLLDVQELTPNSKQIIAYYRGQRTLSDQSLRDYMASHLPDYMIPSSFILLEDYPKTPNGKIDKRALENLYQSARIDKQEFVAAQTKTEIELASIWQELLNLEQIGVHDDFFDLGGHSIFAVQMLVRIRDSFELELELSDLFQTSTISEIGTLIENRNRSKGQPTQQPFKSLIRVNNTNTSDLPTLFIIHGGGGNILFLKDWKKHLVNFNLPLYGFQARGVDGFTPPHKSIEEMSEDYIDEMKAFQPQGPYFIAGYSGGGSIALEMADILRQQGEEVPCVILLDSYHPNIESRNFRLDEHLRDALQNPLSFIRHKFQNRMELAQIAFHAKQIQMHIDNNQPIPLEMRDLYINEHLLRLRKQHRTRPYDGDVVLFRASEVWRIYDHISQDLGWDKALKHLRIIEIPGDHDDLIREPNVGILIAQIVGVLKEYTS